jgi:hypothetical protein
MFQEKIKILINKNLQQVNMHSQAQNTNKALIKTQALKEMTVGYGV